MAKTAPGTNTPKPAQGKKPAPPINRPPDARRRETARPAPTSTTRPTPPKGIPGAAATVGAEGPRVMVRATALGYYDHARRRPGDVFSMTELDAYGGRVSEDGKRVSKPCKWVEPVDPRTPERTTGAQDALNQKHDEILGGRMIGDRSAEPSTAPQGDEDDMLKG